MSLHSEAVQGLRRRDAVDQREADRTFMVAVAEVLVRGSPADEIMQAIGAMVDAYLDLALCIFGNVDPADETFSVIPAWNAEHYPNPPSTTRLSEVVSPDFNRSASAGEPLVIRDTQTDRLTDAGNYAALDLRSFLGVPFSRDGQRRYIVAVADKRPRDWSEEETRLLRQLAARIFPWVELVRAEQAVQGNLEATQMLQTISTRLIGEDDVNTLYQQVLDAGIALMRSDMGSIQIVDPARNVLRLLAWKGFDPGAAEFWDRVGVDTATTCGVALKSGRRVIVSDVESCDFMAGTRDLDLYRLCGIRAVQSTPLVARDGRMLGMISTHWCEAHQPSERDLHLLDVLARQATDIIERQQAADALRESEERMQVIIEASAMGTFLWYPEEDRGEPDERMLKLFGLPLDGTLNLAAALATMIHPEDQGRYAEAVARATDPGGSGLLREDIRVILPDASERWVAIMARTYFEGRPPRPIRMAGTAADITDRKRTEAERDWARAEAETQRAHLHELFMQAPAAIGILRGPDHVYELANGPYLDVVGRRDILGKPIREALPELEGQGIYELFDRAYATGESVFVNETLAATDRGHGRLEEGYFNVVFQPFRDENGEITGLLVFTVEVTEQVLARRQVERLAAERAATLGQIADGIVIADADGTVTFVNEVGQKLLGVSTVGVPPDRRSDVYGLRTIGDEPYPTAELPLVRAMRSREIIRAVDMRIRRPDGSEIIVQVNAAPILVNGEGLAGGVATFRDVTAERDLERQKDDFLSAAAHDLKGPVTVLQGQAQLLQRRAVRGTVDQEQILDGLRLIEKRARTLTGLIDELLDVTRMRMGQVLQLNRTRTDLVELVRGLVASEQSTAEDHRLILECTVGGLVGEWDQVRLSRVLGNLLANAVKYSPDGGEVIVGIGQEEREGRQWATLTVQDRGLGVPAKDLPRIFDWFYRGENVVGIVSGTGVGLAGARQIVEQYGGTIDAESQEGMGSTFTVRLPLDEPHARA